MSEIRVTSVVGENGGDRVGLTTGLTVGPLTGTTGIGATISHQGHAQFAGVCTATSFVGSGTNLTGISQDFVNLGTTTISSAQSQVDIDFDVATYKNFKLYLEGWNPSTDCNMYCRFKISGSISSASNYSSLTIKKYGGGFDSNEYGGTNQNYGYMSHNVGGNGTYETYNAQLEIMTGSGTGMSFMHLATFYRDNGGQYVHNMGIVGWQNFNQIQGIRIYPSTGNITAGKYTLYGIK